MGSCIVYPRLCRCRDRTPGCRPGAGDHEVHRHQQRGLRWRWGLGGGRGGGAHTQSTRERGREACEEQDSGAPFGPGCRGAGVQGCRASPSGDGLWVCVCVDCPEPKLLVFGKLLLVAHGLRATIALSHVPFGRGRPGSSKQLCIGITVMKATSVKINKPEKEAVARGRLQAPGRADVEARAPSSGCRRSWSPQV